MYITDKLVYVQLQKTGSTHIARLLSRTTGGRKNGKHNRPEGSLIESSRIFVSSIRNPWDWYVSLWTFGCGGRGGLREHLMKTSNAEAWEQCYSDSGNPYLFRKWLGMVYDPAFSLDLGEGYGESTVHRMAGFYTYRYLRLCCRNIRTLASGQLQTVDDLQLFEKHNCYIKHWIRIESLEQDLMDILAACGEQLTKADEALILSSRRTNASRRKHPTGYFYDEKATKAVEKKEAIIIEKSGYAFPVMADAPPKNTEIPVNGTGTPPPGK